MYILETSVSVDLTKFARSTNMKFFVDENHVKVGFLRSSYDTESFLLRADASDSTWNVYCCQDGKLSKILAEVLYGDGVYSLQS